MSVLFNVSVVDRDTNGGGVDVKLSTPVKNMLTLMGKTADDDPYNYDIAINTPSKFDLESDPMSIHLDYDTGNGTITQSPLIMIMIILRRRMRIIRNSIL